MNHLITRNPAEARSHDHVPVTIQPQHRSNRGLEHDEAPHLRALGRRRTKHHEHVGDRFACPRLHAAEVLAEHLTATPEPARKQRSL